MSRFSKGFRATSGPESPGERLWLVAGLLFISSLMACGGEDGPSRPDVMQAVATDAAVPAVQAFAASAATLVGDVEAACADPDEATIATAVTAVDDARARWLSLQAMWTGPAMERRAPTIVDWAVDAAGIDELVASDTELTEEVVAGQVGADNRGLRALRGVLARDDAATVLAEPRWCSYASSVAATIATTADALVSDWTISFEEGPPFREIVADPDQAQDWLSMLVNDDIYLVRLVGADVRDEGDVASPDPAGDRAAQLDGIAEVVAALAPLLGDELSARLGGEIAAAIEAFEAGDIERGRALATEVDKTLTTDVAGRLDVTIGFSDADGDGSG